MNNFALESAASVPQVRLQVKSVEVLLLFLRNLPFRAPEQTAFVSASLGHQLASLAFFCKLDNRYLSPVEDWNMELRGNSPPHT